MGLRLPDRFKTTETEISILRMMLEAIKKNMEDDRHPWELFFQAPDYTRQWVVDTRKEVTSYEDTFEEFNSLTPEERENWKQEEAFYIFPISTLEKESTPEARAYFKKAALEAARKWRSPGTILPRIYPTEEEFKEGFVLTVFQQDNEFFPQVLDVFSFNRVSGYDQKGDIKSRFFIQEPKYKALLETLNILRKDITSEPIFPLPQFGISQRLLKTGMTYEEAHQAAAIFRVEMEAYLLETWSHTNPNRSNNVFIRRGPQVRRMVMPFWRDEAPQEEDEELDPNISILRDLPPHLRKGKRKTTFASVPTYFPSREEDEEESRTYDPHSFTTDFQGQDVRNIRANMAARHVGSSDIPLPRLPTIGHGLLRKSIEGDQYTHESSQPFRPTTRPSGSREASNIRLPPDGDIEVEQLPGSQDDPEEIPPYRQGPPYGEPDDPDDEDGPPGRGPPGGPPRGPPRGPPGDRNPQPPRGPGGPYRPPIGPPGGGPPGAAGRQRPQDRPPPEDGFRFEKKIKITDVPEWDGDTDKMLDWLDRLNHLSYRNQRVYDDLGLIAPLRFTGPARQWFDALAPDWQRYAQTDWRTLKLMIADYFMTPQWYDRMKARVLRMRYRQKGFESELPTHYFHRKLRMIKEVFDLRDDEIILEIMNGAPHYWKILIDTSRIHTIHDLQSLIKFHEEALLRDPDNQNREFERRLKQLESRSTNRSSRFARTNEAEAEVNFVKKKPFKKKLIGAHAKFSNYKFPRNDKIVSKGKSPSQKGGRPCRHCGGDHWDFEHPLEGKEDRKARAFLADLDTEALEAYVAYEQCYLQDSDEDPDPLSTVEEEENPGEFSEDEDFHSSPA